MARRANRAKASVSTPTGNVADVHDAIAEMEAVAAAPRQAAFVRNVAREVGGIDLGLKTDEIIVTQRRNELVVVGQRGDDFRRRKWDVDEESDLVDVAAIAQRFGERHQMIVVHPDYIVGTQQLLEILGEEFVDAEITAEIAPREFGEIEPVMQNRPQHAVGEAVVEFLVVILAQIDGGVGDVVVLDDPGRAPDRYPRHARSNRTKGRRAAAASAGSQLRARRRARCDRECQRDSRLRRAAPIPVSPAPRQLDRGQYQS